MTEENMDIQDTQDVATEGNVQQEEQTQAEKTFTQEQVNEIISKRLAQVKSKYDGIDPDEYQQLKQLQSQKEEQELMNRNEFEKLLKKTKNEGAKEVDRLRKELEKIKIDGALISAASSAGSVNPDHIAQLLRQNVRMDANGNVNVVDGEGNIRYTDDADPMAVNDLVNEFLSVNTYYLSAGPSGTGSQGNTQKSSTQSVDLESLDMTKPSDRELYRKYLKEGKL